MIDMDRVRRWFVQGLAIAAPRALREAAWRPRMRLQRAPSPGSPGDETVIERSWLGAQREAPAAAQGKDLPLAIELSPSAVFETSANLPTAAKRRLAEAVALRLDTLSPLPTDAVVHAVGAPGEVVDDRFDIGVAITRRSTIDALLAAPESDAIAVIGADPDESGRFRYVFFERKPNGASRALGPALALVMATALLLGGLDAQLDRQIAESDRLQSELREILNSEKARTMFLDAAPTTAISGLAGADLGDALARLAQVLPNALWMEEIQITSGHISATGYAPVGAVWPPASAPILSPSDRVGVQRFSLTLGLRGQP